MRFDAWLDANRERIAPMAAYFGVTPAAVYQWRDRVPVDRMRGVEKFTDYAVRIEDMVPPARIAQTEQV